MWVNIAGHRTPHDPKTTAVKRVVALEYEQVRTRPPYPMPTMEVPAGHVWVEGDNKDGRKTLDSNSYGPIAMNLIVGRVTHVLFPWSSFGPVRWWQFKRRETSSRPVE